MRGWNRTEFKRKEALVEQLQSRLQQMGPPARNLFYGTTLTVLPPTE
jgi:hypothetical protein